MNYQRHYDLLIEKAQARSSRKTSGLHIHHIVPRWQGGLDDKTNLVVLSHKEHFLAHLLLAKWQGHKKHWGVVKLMSDMSGRKNSRFYEKARKETSGLGKGSHTRFKKHMRWERVA